MIVDSNSVYILESSVHCYLSTLQQTKDLLYYPLSAGCFQCVPGYVVNRQCFDSYLLLVMLDGKLQYETPQSNGFVSPGEVLLLDCHAPHRYAAHSSCSFVFIHFDGAQSEQFYRTITKQHGNVLSLHHTEQITDWMGTLLQSAVKKQLLNEADTSVQIYTTLVMLLSASGYLGISSSTNQAIDDSIIYILSHLSDKLTVEDIAMHIGYSASYFSRIFQQQTGCSPYRFVLRCRIEAAQLRLHTSRDSIFDIAVKLGFGSFSSFCYTFRKETGYSPNEYRRLPII
ncbi:MAG: AraC family transcriptional regulator [Clostridia bacterium]